MDPSGIAYVLDPSRSRPTTLTALLSGAKNSSGDNRVTVYLINVGPATTFGYIDRSTNKMYMFTLIFEMTSTGPGTIGLITYNSMGEQINKANIDGGTPLTYQGALEMIMDSTKNFAQEAADGTRLDDSMVLANPGVRTHETYDNRPAFGGRRRSRRSKKSKRHTRR